MFLYLMVALACASGNPYDACRDGLHAKPVEFRTQAGCMNFARYVAHRTRGLYACVRVSEI